MSVVAAGSHLNEGLRPRLGLQQALVLTNPPEIERTSWLSATTPAITVPNGSNTAVTPCLTSAVFAVAMTSPCTIGYDDTRTDGGVSFQCSAQSSVAPQS